MSERLTLLVYAEESDAPAYAAIAARFPVEALMETTGAGFLRAIPSADLVCMARKYERDWLTQGRRVKWLHVGGTGIDRLLPLADLPPDLVISNTPGLNAEMMADYVLCTLLMLTWNFPRLWRNQRKSRWERWGVERVEGKALAVIGVGNIGQRIAERASHIGLRVYGLERTPEPRPGFEFVGGMDQLATILGQADYVALALPLTDVTRGLFGRRELGWMKKSAFLINVSRGLVVREQELIEALRRGDIAGAALDVFEAEPLPESSELWTLDNVILTPHLSSWSTDYRLRSASIFGQNLERYLAGEPLLHVIDRTKGY